MSHSKVQISAFTLKVLAIIGMTCNHMAHAFMPWMPLWVTFILYAMGGITFPVLAYLLTDGYIYTSSLKKYASRLFIFALIAQVPYYLMFGWHANVLFTLLLSLFLLWAFDRIRPDRPWLFLLALLGVEIISYWCDWAVSGPLIVLCFYYFRTKNAGAKGIGLTMLIPYLCSGVPAAIRFGTELWTSITHGSEIAASIAANTATTRYLQLWITGDPLLISVGGFEQLCMIGYCFIGFSLAWFFLMFYNGQRGRSMKYFFYAYYPLHLLVIWAIRMLIRMG